MTTVIETTIGLTFIYLFLSLICTAVNEAISKLLRLRSRILYSEINKILHTAEDQDKFWKSGVIRTQCNVNNRQQGSAMPATSAPSHLRSTTFAIAAMDVLKNIGDGAAEGQKSKAQNSIFAETTAHLQSLGDSLQTALERWFDETMQNASERYQRQIMVVSFAVAALISIILDADTIKMSQTLWTDEILRHQYLELANGTVQIATNIDEIQLDKLKKDLPASPLGWQTKPADISWGGYLVKAMGWLITTFAITIGAPFWFNTLKKVLWFRNSSKIT